MVPSLGSSSPAIGAPSAYRLSANCVSKWRNKAHSHPPHRKLVRSRAISGNRSASLVSPALGDLYVPRSRGGAMCVPGASASPPASAGQALAALGDALAFLATTDPTALTIAEQADCLRGLQRAESVRIAAQAAILEAFSAGCGHQADGHGTARSWLRWQTRITGSAASAAMAWTRRLAAHPRVRDALAAGAVSESWARQICDWSDLLPASARDAADAILLAAAAAGATLLDLAGLAEEMRARTASPDRDRDDDGFGDRSL